MLNSSKYVNLQLFMQEFLNDILIQVKFRDQYHVVDELKINFFFEFNILSSQRMMINYNKKMLILKCCRKMTVSMTITSIKNKMKCVMKVLKATVILIHNNFLIFIRFRKITKLLVDWNFMFISYQQIFIRFDFDENVLFHIIDVNMCAI